MKCETCGKEIEENTPTVQVRRGYITNGNFEAEYDICYQHEDCYNKELNTVYG